MWKTIGATVAAARSRSGSASISLVEQRNPSTRHRCESLRGTATPSVTGRRTHGQTCTSMHANMTCTQAYIHWCGSTQISVYNANMSLPLCTCICMHEYVYAHSHLPHIHAHMCKTRETPVLSSLLRSTPFAPLGTATSAESTPPLPASSTCGFDGSVLASWVSWPASWCASSARVYCGPSTPSAPVASVEQDTGQ